MECVQHLNANAPASDIPGDHVEGSLAILSAANNLATGTTEDTQAVIDDQVAVLQDAIDAYNLAIVAAAQG